MECRECDDRITIADENGIFYDCPHLNCPYEEGEDDSN